MTDQLRLLLYYPLGCLPPLFFTLRFLVQWIQSERFGKSWMGKGFWQLSLIGNFLLLLHYTVQVQYPFALLQGCNAIVAWRNLDLLKPKPRFNMQKTLGLFFAVLFLITTVFMLQSYLTRGVFEWVLAPVKFTPQKPLAYLSIWHLTGGIGAFLLSTRFLLQWWNAEKNQKSELKSSFWWISLAGSAISVAYFIRIEDVISIASYMFTFIPYIRNLMLIRKSQKRKRSFSFDFFKMKKRIKLVTATKKHQTDVNV